MKEKTIKDICNNLMKFGEEIHFMSDKIESIKIGKDFKLHEKVENILKALKTTDAVIEDLGHYMNEIEAKQNEKILKKIMRS